MFTKELARSVHPEAVDQVIRGLAVTKKGISILEKLLKGEHYTAATEVIPEVMQSIVDFESGLQQLRVDAKNYLDEVIAARENMEKVQREAFQKMIKEKETPLRESEEVSLGDKDESVPDPQTGNSPQT